MTNDKHPQTIEEAREVVEKAMKPKHSPTPWEHRPELKTSYDSQTGVKNEQWQHWIYSGDNFVALASTEPVDINAKHIVNCVNSHAELIEQRSRAS